MARGPESRRERKEREKTQKIEVRTQKVASTLERIKDKALNLTPAQQKVLELKLDRHFQLHNSIDVNVLADALKETPKYLDSEEGTLHRLFEIHQQKTLIKIAERRKKLAELDPKDGEINPWENLFETKSGKYYLARLFNREHLEEESEFLQHCVGIEDSYINKIISGEVEIFSFRKKPHLDVHNNHDSDGDDLNEPIVTIEYNRKTKVIEQIKGMNDELIADSDEFEVGGFLPDLIDALRQLKESEDEYGNKREFTINPDELDNIGIEEDKVLFYDKDNKQHIVSMEDFKLNPDNFVLKVGWFSPVNRDPSVIATALKLIHNIDCTPEEIALHDSSEITVSTKVFLDDPTPEVFRAEIPYIFRDDAEFNEMKPGFTFSKYPVAYDESKWKDPIQELEKAEVRLDLYAKTIFRSEEFTSSEVEEGEIIVVRADSLSGVAYIDQETALKRGEKFGLKAVPPKLIPQLLLQLEENTHMCVAMHPLDVSVMSGAVPTSFSIGKGKQQAYLNVIEYNTNIPIHDSYFAFFLPKKESSE